MTRMLPKAVLVFGFVLSLGITGCNIFGTEDRPTGGPEADELKARLTNFLESGSTAEMTTEELYAIAKEARANSDMGVLSLYQQISNADNQFPFEDLAQAAREDNYDNFVAIEQSLGLILYANYWQEHGEAGKITRVAVGVSDEDLKDAAQRIKQVSGLNACGFYTDYIAARALRLTIEFRKELEKIAPGVSVTGTGTEGYQVQFGATQPTPLQLKSLFEAFRDDVTSLLYVVANPGPVFGCTAALVGSDGEDVIINIDDVNAFLDDALLRFANQYITNLKIASR